MNITTFRNATIPTSKDPAACLSLEHLTPPPRRNRHATFANQKWGKRRNFYRRPGDHELVLRCR